MDEFERIIKETKRAAAASGLNSRQLGELCGYSYNAFRFIQDKDWNAGIQTVSALRKGLKAKGHLK